MARAVRTNLAWSLSPSSRPTLELAQLSLFGAPSLLLLKPSRTGSASRVASGPARTEIDWFQAQARASHSVYGEPSLC